MSEVVQPVEIVVPIVEEGAEKKEGIKETLELIALLQTSADVYAAAKADDSIDYKDLTKLGPMIPALKDGLGGSNKIGAELKDLDKEEAVEVINKLVAAMSSFVAAVVS